MLRIRPFAALRPRRRFAARVASVPYDVVSTEEARQLAAGNPHSFLRVLRPEVDLAPGTSPHDETVYVKARENLDSLIENEVLIREPERRIYLYRQSVNGRSQVGIVACCHIDDYREDRIRKHEGTRRETEDDRTRHAISLNANAGPVLLAFRDRPEIHALMQRDVNEKPLYHFEAPDGVIHTVWTVRDADPYVRAFQEVPCAYVADGHHRSASAARVGAERRAANPGHTGEEEYNWFLTVLFPASDLKILPYNRVVASLNGLSRGEFLERLGTIGTCAPTTEPSPERAGVFCLYVEGGWHRVEIPADTIDRCDPVGSLDVSLLQARVLAPLLGISDQRTDPRVDFVGGVRGTEALQRRVDAGGAGAAFSLHPTTIDQLFRVADAGLSMPPKSTWFEPKLRSGLFIHTLE